MDHRSNGAHKVMFYCHDTYGLGHLRRTLTLANDLRARMPGISQLIVTGSPVAHGFQYPEGADYIKLPSVSKNGEGCYEARSIDSPFDDVRDMRGDILLSAAHHFEPDVLIVDHAPAGLKGEAVPTLRYLKERRPETKLVVGLRDVIDEPPKVRQAWLQEGVYELLDDVYDQILVYGDRDLYDLTATYGLSPRAAAKTRFVGYLGREPGRRSREDLRASLNLRTDNLVVVVAGGGGDGERLFASVLAGLQFRAERPGFDCLLIGGPLMSEGDRARLHGLMAGMEAVHFMDFTDDLMSYLGAADAVVSMGGYNSTCEILSVDCPAIIVPRVRPRKEQLIRAEMLDRLGLVTMIDPEELTARRIMEGILGLLSRPRANHPKLPMSGLPAVAEILSSRLLRPAERSDRQVEEPIGAGFDPFLAGFQTLAGREALSKLIAATSLFAAF